MQLTRRFVTALLSSSLAFLALSRAAYGGTVVKVSLWDKGPTSMDMMDTLAPMGMAMKNADMAMAKMGITVDPPAIAAGEVTFEVINESGEFYHEMVIARVEDPARELPYLMEERRVDEDAAGHFAELKELKPHQSGTLTVNMAPGTYILYCNIAGHYMMGMWTLVTVAE